MTNKGNKLTREILTSLGIIHFDKDEDEYDGPLFGRNWLDDEKHYCPQPASSSESWDEIKRLWINYVARLNKNEPIKSFEQWLSDNYNPPTRK